MRRSRYDKIFIDSVLEEGIVPKEIFEREVSLAEKEKQKEANDKNVFFYPFPFLPFFFFFFFFLSFFISFFS